MFCNCMILSDNVVYQCLSSCGTSHCAFSYKVLLFLILFQFNPLSSYYSFNSWYSWNPRNSSGKELQRFWPIPGRFLFPPRTVSLLCHPLWHGIQIKNTQFARLDVFYFVTVGRSNRWNNATVQFLLQLLNASNTIAIHLLFKTRLGLEQ